MSKHVVQNPSAYKMSWLFSRFPLAGTYKTKYKNGDSE